MNPLYDYSSVVMKYSKVVEEELYIFMRKVFMDLMEYDVSLKEHGYQVRGRDYTLQDIVDHKPNYGTYSYLLRSREIKDAVHGSIKEVSSRNFILFDVSRFIKIIQNIRNASVHGDATTISECETIRCEVLGVGRCGVLSRFFE